MSGRELHVFLGVRAHYRSWFPRMVEYGFVENRDYELVAQKRATNNPRNPWTEITDHAISLDMAKHISMIQRTPKGKQARLYFIECERQLTEPKPQTLEERLADGLLAAKEVLERRKEQTVLSKPD